LRLFQGRQSDTSAIFADQSLLDVNPTAIDDEPPTDSASFDDQPMIADQTPSTVNRAECCDNGELPTVADVATAELAADVKPIVLGELDRQSGGSDCSLDDRATAKSSDDRIADNCQSVVVSGSVGVKAEKSCEDLFDVLDVVIKREVGEGLEQCPATEISFPVKMETDVTDEQVRTDTGLDVEGSGMEIDASEPAEVAVKTENS
jgi:hypothetical protein